MMRAITKLTGYLVVGAMLLAPAGLTAQEVYIEDGKIIFDMTVAAGMPDGAQTSTSKGTHGAGLNTSAANWFVYEKLEIAPQDMTDSGAGFGTGSVLINWTTANARCQGLTHNGNSNWRIPTLRELTMIWIFRDAIETFSGNTFSSGSNEYYWSATPREINTTFHIAFATGYMNVSFNSSGNVHYARCVREVPVTP